MKNQEKNVYIHFDAKAAGKSLIEIEVDLIESEGGKIISRRYHSQRDVDLYVWVDHRNNVIKQQMSIGGLLIEWNILDGIKTGIIIEEEDTPEKVKQGVHYDKTPISTSIRQASEIIQFASMISENDRMALLDNFKKNPRFQSLKIDELKQKFGPQISKIKNLNFWNKFKGFFKF